MISQTNYLVVFSLVHLMLKFHAWLIKLSFMYWRPKYTDYNYFSQNVWPCANVKNHYYLQEDPIHLTIKASLTTVVPHQVVGVFLQEIHDQHLVHPVHLR